MLYSPGVSLLIGAAVLAVAFLLVWPKRGLVAKRRRERRLTNRVLGEDALKFLAGREAANRGATLQAVAGALEIDLNRATRILEDLIARGLAAREDDVLSLTEPGRDVALHLIRAHRLWEVYLSQRTGYEPTEWHERADAREHSLSAPALDDLARDLGHPVFDPDGDPIPGEREADYVRHHGEPLSKTPVGRWVRVVHVEDEPAAVYTALTEAGIYPGLELQVVASEQSDFRVLVHGEERALSPLAAANVAVSVTDQDVERAETIALSDAGIGQTVTVVDLAGACRGAERRRLLDLGLVRGTVVVPQMRSPGGDPTAYRVREALIALRRTQAQNIRVSTGEAV